MVTNRQRILGVIALVLIAVLNVLTDQDVLDQKLALILHDVIVYALPLLGVGALADVLATEKRRVDPTTPALRDDVRE